MASPVKRWENPIVDLGHAKYEGVYNETTNIQYFLGIRYAADTCGENIPLSTGYIVMLTAVVVPGLNRFRAPQPPVPTSHLHQANTPALNCAASFNGGGQTFNATIEQHFLAPTFGEDCLWLNVYIPPGATLNGSLPVLVNIHGGGYVAPPR